MKELVKHLVRENLEEIVSKSLLHCHVRGLHSIMFIDTPESRVRLYIATPEHEMYGSLTRLFDGDDHAFLSFHPHHCNLTISCIYGELTNWVIAPVEKDGLLGLRRYLYRSQITDGKIGFIPMKSEAMGLSHATTLGAGDSLYMDSTEIHSVSVPKGEMAAWFVFEGKEDKDYLPISYSFNDMESYGQDNTLYQKPTVKDVVELLLRVGLLGDTNESPALETCVKSGVGCVNACGGLCIKNN